LGITCKLEHEQTPNGAGRVLGRHERVKRGKWIFLWSVIATSADVLEKTDVVVVVVVGVVAGDRDIDDKAGKYG
jgi:hypothetical protein